MAKKGAVWVHREIQNHWLWQPEGKHIGFSRGQAFVDLLLRAQHALYPTHHPGFSYLINLKRGQLYATDVELSEAWGWGREKVKIFLERELTECGSVIIGRLLKKVGKSTPPGRVITLINYDYYQKGFLESTVSRQYPDTNKNVKNEKEEKPFVNVFGDRVGVNGREIIR